jgi:tetratricopeptide (TPR) repeat protein
MRRVLILLSFLLFAVAMAGAQNSTFAEYETEHYRVLSEMGEEHAQQTAEKLEALLAFFNDYFHFEVADLPTRLRARFFSSKDRYDEYISRATEDEQRDDFAHLHYRDLARSELVGYDLPEEDFEISLKHHGFIQFLRAFIAEPPIWMREGFAVYFEEVEYDDQIDSVIYRENLGWLETLQSMIDGSAGVEPLSLHEMVRMTASQAEAQVEVFYPQAWGMVSFLLNSENRDYNRIVWDSISALDPEATLSENSNQVFEEAFRWVQEPVLIESFVEYVGQRKSFRVLVQEGIDHYENEEFEEAERSFVTAIKLNEENFIPHYYMGLINYNRGNYSLADFYYNEALELGANEATTYYALGVNAFADNRFDEARGYLEQSNELDPEQYGDKVSQLIDRIDG